MSKWRTATKILLLLLTVAGVITAGIIVAAIRQPAISLPSELSFLQGSRISENRGIVSVQGRVQEYYRCFVRGRSDDVQRAVGEALSKDWSAFSPRFYASKSASPDARGIRHWIRSNPGGEQYSLIVAPTDNPSTVEIIYGNAQQDLLGPRKWVLVAQDRLQRLLGQD